MPQFVDYTGQKINNWNVIKQVGFNEYGESMWIAECDCENKIRVERRLSSIKRFPRCIDCINIEKLEKRKKEIIGMKYEKLTIVGYYGYRDDVKTTAPFWIAKCNCGSDKDIIATTYEFKSGRIKSCGCARQHTEESIAKLSNTRRKYNEFEIKDDYVVGKTDKGEEFYFDKEDYDLVVGFNKYLAVNNIGYVLARTSKQEYQLHRLIMGVGVYNKEDDIIVDHIDGNKLNNRKSNLRVCKRKHNPKNCTIYSNNTSGHKGVTWKKSINKWQVNLQCNKKNLYLGVYSDFDEAVEIRKNAEIKYFGEFSREYREEYINNK